MLIEMNIVRKMSLIILIGLLILSIVGCGEKQPVTDDKDKIAAEQASEREKSLNEFAVSNNAVPLNREISDSFSLGIENSLKVSENKSIAFYADIIDVGRKDDNYYIVADYGFYPTIKMVLNCDKNLAEQVMKQNVKSDNVTDILYWDALMIAKVSSVSKVDFGISPDEDSESPRIWVDTDEELFIARGQCLNILIKPVN